LGAGIEDLWIGGHIREGERSQGEKEGIVADSAFIRRGVGRGGAMIAAYVRFYFLLNA
jgi:hypothetical protein